MAEGIHLWAGGIGSGPPVVWVHGGAGNMDHRSFLPWILPLATDYTLVLYDQRGSGRSATAPSETCHLRTFVGDLEALRRDLELPQIVVVGHSAGGFVALLYAIRHPERVCKVVTIGTAATHRFIEEGRKLLAQRATPGQLGAFDGLWSGAIENDEEYRATWRIVLPTYYADPANVQAIPEDLPFSIAVRHSVGLDIKRLDLTPLLPHVQVPVLVTVGAQDWICPLPEAETLAESLPQGRLAVFARSGHFPFVEETDHFLTTLHGFINDPVNGGQP